MFTGLIDRLGTVSQITPKGNYREITITPEHQFENLVQGESIAVSGPCLTVTRFDEKTFTVEASQETIRVTTLKNCRQGMVVNLERALRASDRLGGHIVAGHIDTVLPIKKITPIGKSLELTIDLPREYQRLIVDKGSVALDGVSLTVTSVGAHEFSVNLIPETQNRTTLPDRRAGDQLNIEFDIIGKYILRYLDAGKTDSGLSLGALRDMGY